MAEVNIKTRLSLRYDTLANWNSANPVLNKGEVAVVAIPSTATGNDTYGQDTKPSILFKVGDGTSNFKALPYASGRAADVYAWAKAATKPTYTASEVGAAEEDHIHTGDEIYVSGMDGDTLEDWAEAIATNVDSRALSSDVYTKSQVDTKIKEIQGALEADTNTQYNLEWSETEKLLILSSKDIGGNWEVVTKLTPGSFTLSSAAGTELSGKTFDAVISGLKSKVDGLEQDLDTYYYDKDEVDQAIGDIEAGLADGSITVYAASRAEKDNKGNVIDTTYATKQELSYLAQDLDELDYESVGAAAASHTHTKSEITDFSHTHTASEVNYEGSIISAASGQNIQVAVDAVYGGLNTHTASKTNPHGVTAAQVGLGNVLNVASYAKSETMSTTEIGTAIADAEGRASEYADDVVGTLRTAVTNGTVVAGKASKDGNGSVIVDTYATKTELTTGLSGKADSSALSQQVSRLEGLIDDAVEDVEEIANGKTRTYVLSYTGSDSSFNNSIFNSNSDTIDLTQSHKIGLIDGTTLNQSSGLKVGDVFLVKETNVPDRWVMSVNGSGTFTLAKMETAKVDLTPYVLASTVINGKTLEDDIDLTGADINVSSTDKTKISTALATLSEDLSAVTEAFQGGEYTVAKAEEATKATQDGDGNVITSTYATKEALNTLGNAFESVEWALFNITAGGKVSLNTESSKINSKLNDYMSKMATNDLTGAQIVERGLKFVMIDPTDVRWQGHISCFDINRGIVSLKFECDSLDTISPYNGYDITVAYKSGTVINFVLERRFNPSDVYILNGGNAAGAY